MLLGVTVHISADGENRHAAIRDAEDIGKLWAGRGGGDLSAARSEPDAAERNRDAR